MAFILCRQAVFSFTQANGESEPLYQRLTEDSHRLFFFKRQTPLTPYPFCGRNGEHTFTAKVFYNESPAFRGHTQKHLKTSRLV